MVLSCRQQLFNCQVVQVKSLLDPCEDENDDMEEDEVSLVDESLHLSDFSDFDSEVNLQYFFNFMF